MNFFIGLVIAILAGGTLLAVGVNKLKKKKRETAPGTGDNPEAAMHHVNTPHTHPDPHHTAHDTNHGHEDGHGHATFKKGAFTSAVIFLLGAYVLCLCAFAFLWQAGWNAWLGEGWGFLPGSWGFWLSQLLFLASICLFANRWIQNKGLGWAGAIVLLLAIAVATMTIYRHLNPEEEDFSKTYYLGNNLESSVPLEIPEYTRGRIQWLYNWDIAPSKAFYLKPNNGPAKPCGAGYEKRDFGESVTSIKMWKIDGEQSPDSVVVHFHKR